MDALTHELSLADLLRRAVMAVTKAASLNGYLQARNIFDNTKIAVRMQFVQNCGL
jgi:hypothetical protein